MGTATNGLVVEDDVPEAQTDLPKNRLDLCEIRIGIIQTGDLAGVASFEEACGKTGTFGMFYCTVFFNQKPVHHLSADLVGSAHLLQLLAFNPAHIMVRIQAIVGLPKEFLALVLEKIQNGGIPSESLDGMTVYPLPTDYLEVFQDSIKRFIGSKPTASPK